MDRENREVYAKAATLAAVAKLLDMQPTDVFTYVIIAVTREGDASLAAGCPPEMDLETQAHLVRSMLTDIAASLTADDLNNENRWREWEIPE